MKKINFKLMAATAVIAAFSVCPAFAGTSKVTSTDVISVNGSYVGTLVNQSNKRINISNENVEVGDYSGQYFNGSVVDTAVIVGNDTINANGKKVVIDRASELGLNGSAAGTIIKDSTVNIRTKSR